MLKTMKKFNKFKKPFYGINCGSVGFLMNKYIMKKIEYKIKKANIIQINPLQIITRSKENKKLDLAAEDIRMAIKNIQSLFGNVDIEDILDIVFSDFCIGK